MPTGTLLVEVRLRSASNLKEKRSIVRHLLDTARHRYRVAAGEVGAQDRVHRSELAFATVSGDVAQVEAVLDEIERWVWSHPEVEVLECSREWSEERS